MIASEVKSAFADYKQDISDVDDTLFLRWVDYINRFAYRIIRDQSPDRFITTQNYTVTTSPSAQALPASFRDINVPGCGLFERDSDNNPTDMALPVTGYGSGTKGFWLDPTNINFTGINSSTVFTLRYIPVIAEIDELSDTLVIPDEYLRYVIDAVDVLYSQWDEDRGSESFADARFVRALDELVRNIRLQPSTFAFFDISSSY